MPSSEIDKIQNELDSIKSLVGGSGAQNSQVDSSGRGSEVDREDERMNNGHSHSPQSIGKEEEGDEEGSPGEIDLTTSVWVV